MDQRPPLVALLGAPGTGAQALASVLRERIPPDTLQVIACAKASRPIALTLLMGLDLPCPPDQRSAQEAADSQLRTALNQANIAYQVVYGQGSRRIDNALRAINTIANSTEFIRTTGTFGKESARLRPWNCEKCSDPECEHRLFSALLRPAEPILV